MKSPIATKLRPPRQTSSLIDRTRLTEALETADEPLILLSAPPGYGKTTIVTQWLASTAASYAWLSLDAADNDPARFFGYLLAAVRLASGAAGEASDLPADADPGLLVGEAVRVLDAAEADGPPRQILVLDDYHVIESAKIHEAIALLVERLPANAQLVVATRVDPPLPLPRLRARGLLRELRVADLRFTGGEAARLVHGAVGDRVADARIEALNDRTEGWPATLQLACAAIRGRPDAAEVVDRFGAGHRFILDYVVDEVLSRLEPQTHEFLLQTSILPRLTGPLCDAVTGRTDGAITLETLVRANLLLVPLDDERQWYRFHSLFADLLRARLLSTRPGLEPELRDRAAGWLEAHGELDEAFHQYVAGLHLADALRLFRAHWHAFAHAGELGVVWRWLVALPDDAVKLDPQISTAFGWLLMLRGERDGVARRLDEAEIALAGDAVEPIDRLIVPTQIASLRSRLALLGGDTERAIAEARAAIDLVPDAIPPMDRALFRGDGTLMLAHALRNAGSTAAAEVTYAAALPLLRDGGNRIAAGYCLTALADLKVRTGHSREAVELIETALADARLSASPAVASVRVAFAGALAALGNRDRARAEALTAAEVARRTGQAATLRAATAVLDAFVAEPQGPDRRAQTANGRLLEPLTPRELEVLRLVAAGRSNRQIAAELFVTAGTAKVHVHSISQKLGAANRVEAIVRARELGLLD